MAEQTVWVVVWQDYECSVWRVNCDTKETALAYLKEAAEEHLDSAFEPSTAQWRVEDDEIEVRFVSHHGESSFDECLTARPVPVVTAANGVVM